MSDIGRPPGEEAGPLQRKRAWRTARAPLAIAQGTEPLTLSSRPSIAALQARLQARPGYRGYDGPDDIVAVIRWIREGNGPPPARWNRAT
ncbi:MAG: hypothetical protein WCH83_06225 [Alphaproteobacteria bacterium]